MKTVFFSWQSDDKAVRNRLGTAMEKAVLGIDYGLEESERPELDSDTKGVHGSEDIIATIFSKIDSCAVFVADVTPIARVGDKLVPNPNVMAELGYAVKSKGVGTRLFIYCDDGTMDEKLMPFDIRGKSLIKFRPDQGPAEIAAVLAPRLAGMLAGVPDGDKLLEHPYIYITGGTHTHWADGESFSLSLRSDEEMEYLLDEVEVEGHSWKTDSTLSPKAVTAGVVLTGKVLPFRSADPHIRLTVSRGSKKYHIELTVTTRERADGDGFNPEKWVPKPKITAA